LNRPVPAPGVGSGPRGYNGGVATEVPHETTNGKAHGATWARPSLSAERPVALRRGGDHIEVTAPARPDSLQLARLTAAYVAAQADLLFDDVQDLRLAIDELCLSLLPAPGADGSDGRLTLSFSWDDRAVEVTCTVVDADGGAAADGDDLQGGHDGDGLGSAAWARQILDALVDDHAVSYAPSRRLGWLRKQRVGAAKR